MRSDVDGGRRGEGGGAHAEEVPDRWASATLPAIGIPAMKLVPFIIVWLFD